jgi:N utilization substance protein A
MNIDIMDALAAVAKEKKIDREALHDIIESIFRALIKKRYENDDNFDIIVNIEKGDIEIYQEKTVVEKVEDEQYEIALEDARKVEEDIEVGDDFVEVINPDQFGRRLIHFARQQLLQRIRDFEKEKIVAEYENRIGEIIIGDIHQITKNGAYINLDKTEVFLPKREQIRKEHLRRNESIRAVIKEVKSTKRGPEIIVSRTDEKFLERLFEIEVPEIYDGTVIIRGVAREPGERAKVAVESIDRRVDAVGACVGMKGMRIQSIVQELSNEKIDIINYSSEPEIFITRALSPAKPVRVDVDKEEREATAVIPDEQMSLAIGRNGVNLTLAQRLTGFEIDLIKESEYFAEEEVQDADDYAVAEILVDEVPEEVIATLEAEGIETLGELKRVGLAGLLEIKGIDKATAQKILSLTNI